MIHYTPIIATLIAILLVSLWITKSTKKTESGETQKSPSKKRKEGTHAINQMHIVLSHIDMYGSICYDEAKTLYGIKNLKAVIHKIRTKTKVEIVNIYHTGTKRFYGYGINK